MDEEIEFIFEFLLPRPLAGDHVCELHECGGETLCLVNDGVTGSCQCSPRSLSLSTGDDHINCHGEGACVYIMSWAEGFLSRLDGHFGTSHFVPCLSCPFFLKPRDVFATHCI